MLNAIRAVLIPFFPDRTTKIPTTHAAKIEFHTIDRQL